MQIQPNTVKLPPGALPPQNGIATEESSAEKDKPSVVQEKFQDAVAGTFYRTMLKALRSTEKKPAYLDGGQAEDIFKGQLDEQFSDLLAKNNGAELSDSLFQVMQERWKSQAAASSGLSATNGSTSDTESITASNSESNTKSTDPLQHLIDAVTKSRTEFPAGVPLPKGPAASLSLPQVREQAATRSYNTASLQETAHVLNLVG